MFMRSLRTPLVGRCLSTWAHVKEGPPDPILGLSQAFIADDFAKKVNLGVGAYRDDNGKPFVLESVKKAEQIVTSSSLDKEYAPIGGLAAFTQAAASLMFGPSLAADRTVSMQTISGTGALRVVAAFLDRFHPSKVIYLPTPTWANHIPVAKDAGLEVRHYRYYRDSDSSLDLEGMLEDLKDAPEGSTILLHACAHNPTGLDPTMEQWQVILDAMKAKNHFTFFDAAYQGFASGDPTRDAGPVRMFVDQGMDMLVTQSFAKNFGLYGERVGCLHFVCATAEEKKNVESQLKILIRPFYSNPPIHGARIVAEVLKNPELTALWESEVRGMADRIIGMRHALVKELAAAGSTRNWDHVTTQIGMFSYTGLTKAQVDRMIAEFHIYLTGNGRISMAGVTSHNVQYLAQSMHEVTK